MGVMVIVEEHRCVDTVVSEDVSEPGLVGRGFGSEPCPKEALEVAKSFGDRVMVASVEVQVVRVQVEVHQPLWDILRRGGPDADGIDLVAGQPRDSERLLDREEGKPIVHLDAVEPFFADRRHELSVANDRNVSVVTDGETEEVHVLPLSSGSIVSRATRRSTECLLDWMVRLYGCGERPDP